MERDSCVQVGTPLHAIRALAANGPLDFEPFDITLRRLSLKPFIMGRTALRRQTIFSSPVVMPADTTPDYHHHRVLRARPTLSNHPLMVSIHVANAIVARISHFAPRLM